MVSTAAMFSSKIVAFFHWFECNKVFPLKSLRRYLWFFTTRKHPFLSGNISLYRIGMLFFSSPTNPSKVSAVNSNSTIGRGFILSGSSRSNVASLLMYTLPFLDFAVIKPYLKLLIAVCFIGRISFP